MAQENSAKCMKEVNIFVPTCYNNGEPIPRENLRCIENVVADLFDGYTLNPSLQGVWVNSQGILFRDSVTVVKIVVEDSPKLLVHISEVGELIHELCKQEEVFITINDCTEGGVLC